MVIIVLIIYNNSNKVKKLDNLVAIRTEALINEMETNKQLFDKIIKAERSKNNYFINLSHELRTPLNVISSVEQLISNLNRTEKGISKEKIDEYNTRFAEINAEILAIARDGIDTQYIGGELAWPVPGYTRISSKYGMRTHPITGVYKLHTGVDISAPLGANFIAANDGIVTKAGYNSAYGNMVIIDHGGGVSTLYAHGSEILVQVGQVVKRGESILKVGSTGYSTGPHAHFEVRLNGVVTDPMPYITNGLIPGTKTEQEEQDSNTNETQNTVQN